LRQFAHSPSLGHLTTFGGHPVPCAASAAASVLLQSTDWNRVEQVGQSIEAVMRGCPQVREVRRIGLYIAVELDSAEAVKDAVQIAMQRGVLVFYFLSTPKAFRIAPPLNINDVDLQEALDTLIACIEQAHA
jgi:acetylornithine/succinyldiaminopimelate/putrescine aminotransferase